VIEARVGSPHGRLIARCEYTGGGVFEAEAESLGGKHDVHLLFAVDGKYGASMMDVDWFAFVGATGSEARVEAEAYSTQGVAGNPLLPEPVALLRVARFRGARPAPVVIPIANAGAAPLTWKATADKPWIRVGVADRAELPPGAVDGKLAIHVRADNLPKGVHWGTVMLQARDRSVAIGVRLER